MTYEYESKSTRKASEYTISILVKAPNTEPASEQVSVKSADDELIDEPDEEIALSKNIDCDVDSTRPRETSRREM